MRNIFAGSGFPGKWAISSWKNDDLPGKIVKPVFQWSFYDFSLVDQFGLNYECRQQKQVSVTPCQADNYVPHRKVDVGFSTADELRKQLNDKKISERVVMDFREKARKCFRDIFTKIAAKSPLKYKVIRHMKWLDPREIARDYDAAASLLQKLLHDLVATKYVQTAKCDPILQEFREFCDLEVSAKVSTFLHFDPADARLDVFFHEFLNTSKYKHLWSRIRLCLLLSHGQASVERGFSVNKEITVESMKERSLVSQRIICDHLRFVGGVENINVTQQMMVAAKNSRQTYMAHLEEKRREVAEEVNRKKRGALLEERWTEKKATKSPRGVGAAPRRSWQTSRKSRGYWCDHIDNKIEQFSKNIEREGC